MTTWYECEELIRDVNRGCTSFVMKHVDNSDDKIIYYRAMRNCEKIIRDADSAIDAMNKLSTYEMTFHKELNEQAFWKKLVFRDKTKYKFMATEHAFDAVNCISNRFGVM